MRLISGDIHTRTSSTLSKILLEILCPIEKVLSSSEVEAAESVGTAWALTGILRASTTFSKQKRSSHS